MIALAMALALMATIVFAIDLTAHGVPIATHAGVSVYSVTEVPPAGWGYDLHQVPAGGSWLGTLGAAVGLTLVANVLAFAAVLGAPRERTATVAQRAFLRHWHGVQLVKAAVNESRTKALSALDNKVG
jgi:hypothetical protein